MDAFELLKVDHKKVAELFDRLEAASGKRKLDVFKRIKSELDVHTHIEEKFLYPALEKPKETHDLTLEAYEEHKVVKTLLAELSSATSATDEWQAKAKVLRENVEHHVKEEENELFKKADKTLSDDEIDALGNRMAAEKARKLGKPVPKSGARPISKKKATKPGLISKLASLVGLGSSSTKKATKKVPAKVAAKKKTTVAKSSTKASKSSSAPGKRTTTTASKRTTASRAGSVAKSGKKSAKKRASHK